MKKVLLSIGFVGLILSSASVSAQSFSLEVASDTFKVAITKPNIDVYNKITNTTGSNLKIEWKVLGTDFPASWGDATRLGMCDNSLCRNNDNNQLLNGTQFTSLDYAPSVEGDWHFQLVDFLNVTPGTHYCTIEYKESGGSYADTTTYVFTVFATDVNNIKANAKDVVIYPNPATDKLNVSLPKGGDAKKITLHNFVGKEVANYNVTSENISLNIKDIPAGMYYIRVADAQGRVIQTKRFTHR